MAWVLAVVEDLFFGAKILETAERLNVRLALVRSREELVEKLRVDRPGLVIFDLNAEGCRPLEAIRRLKADPALKDIITLGFFSHVQHELKIAATEAGCDQILTRSAFSTRLPEILCQYGSAD